MKPVQRIPQTVFIKGEYQLFSPGISTSVGQMTYLMLLKLVLDNQDAAGKNPIERFSLGNLLLLHRHGIHFEPAVRLRSTKPDTISATVRAVAMML